MYVNELRPCRQGGRQSILIQQADARGKVLGVLWPDITPAREITAQALQSWRDQHPLKGGTTILNETTRLAVVANAKLGMLIVQGWEADGAATRIFRYGVPA